MKLMIQVLVSLFLMTSLITVTQAGDVKAGRKKASTCFSCHGFNGIGTNGQNPNLAGQKEAYLIKATMAYRDGSRGHEMMKTMVKSLTEEDIKDIAAFYSSLK